MYRNLHLEQEREEGRINDNANVVKKLNKLIA
jgi:hypothetical protein